MQFTGFIDAGELGELEVEVTYHVTSGFKGSREEPSEDGQMSIDKAVMTIHGTQVELSEDAYELLEDQAWDDHWSGQPDY